SSGSLGWLCRVRMTPSAARIPIFPYTTLFRSEQLEGAFRPVGRQHAGAPQFEESASCVARNERTDIELALRIESVAPLRLVLPQQPVSADHTAMVGTFERRVHDDKMITGRIEAIGIASFLLALPMTLRAEFEREDGMAQLLRGSDFRRCRRKPRFQVADAAEQPRR